MELKSKVIQTHFVPEVQRADEEGGVVINMKEKTIAKINTFGKVGNVISKIAMIMMGIFAVCTLGGMIACMVLPQNILELRIGNTITTNIDISGFGETLPESEQENLENSMLSDYNLSEFGLNGTVFDMQTVEADDTSIIMRGAGEDTVFDIKDVTGLAGFATLLLVTTFVLFLFIGRFCKELSKCESPFSEVVVRKMNLAAIFMIPWLVIWNTTDTVVKAILSNSKGLSFTLNIGMIITILMICGLVTIFKYGSMLQQESDETL